ncbi:MAG: helix-turn-helix domain-containing protein [Deltaproteobacteria bacterium]|nr:helix-turn-helix domain-containing protein [Deltaproteobacteria bacterium]
MDEKEQDNKTEDVGVSSEKPEETTLDLRTIRTSRGLTLKDVSSSTRISPQNLKAIEEQRFELLPEPIYARAFIDMYAKALDVDGKKILSLYDTYLKSLEPDDDRYELLKKLAAKKRHMEIWIWVIIVLGLLALTGSFYLYQWSTSGRQTAEGLSPAGKISIAGEPQEALEERAPEETPAEESGGGAVEGESEPPEADSAPAADLSVADSMQELDQAIAEDTQPPTETEQPVAGEEQPVIEAEQPVEQLEEVAEVNTAVPAEEKPYIMVIEASELTWIEIGRDGEPSFEVMLWPGERITEKASERFVLLIGNAGGVNIRFQERSLGPLGEHGEVIRLTLPADE